MVSAHIINPPLGGGSNEQEARLGRGAEDDRSHCAGSSPAVLEFDVVTAARSAAEAGPASWGFGHSLSCRLPGWAWLRCRAWCHGGYGRCRGRHTRPRRDIGTTSDTYVDRVVLRHTTTWAVNPLGPCIVIDRTKWVYGNGGFVVFG